jgi:DNA topoisomerase-2
MKEITTDKFFNTQYRQYSNYDNERSIANLVDGLKTAQRKVLYTCTEKNINSEYKVAQLGSLVANFTQYHHGEQNLSNVITNLAQSFVGTNNQNYLTPLGQFGSRLSPIPASPRYIFTHLSKNFREFFKKDDDIILEYLYEDEDQIEPKFFIPILPGILLNSSQGIGTGFASFILARNPIEVSNYIKAKLNKIPVSAKFLPYFKNFKGSISYLEETKYQIQGVFVRVSTTQIKITELPVGMYLDDIKKRLNSLIDSGYIKDYDDNSTEESFDVDVYFQRGNLANIDDVDLLDKLKLSTTLTENLTCWLDNGKLKKFNNVTEIIDYFVEFRLTKYSQRIDKLIEISDRNIKLLSEKIRFINFYLDNVDKFKNSGKKDLDIVLKNESFESSMLDLKMYNLTLDKITELNDALKKLVKQRVKLLKTKNIDLYLSELGNCNDIMV